MSSGFADVPAPYAEPEKAQVVILPVPFDKTSTWLKGADKGPQAIIEASWNMELYDIETDSEVYRQGIFTAEAIGGEGSVEEMIEAVREEVTKYLKQGKFCVVLGGEHSVSIGAVQAHAGHWGDGISVLQLDAHADLRGEYDGSKYNHACVMARVRESAEILQVGLRSMDAGEKKDMDRSKVFFAHEIHGNKDWLGQATAKLGEKVYITVDLDVFDPSIMPSTGTPEPGGLDWYEGLAILKEVCSRKKVVGLDVVELCPNPANKASDFLAAKLIYKFLSYYFRG